MSKQDFLSRLGKGLSGLPQEDVEERIAFYSEMIDDSMEEGLSEEEAVSSIGSVDEIISQILTEIPLTKIVKESVKTRRRLGSFEIVLLVLGAPVWLSLLIAGFAVAISLYAVLWSVGIALWAVFAALAGSAVGVFAAGLVFAFGEYSTNGLAAIAGSFICSGLAIYMFFGCVALTKSIVILSKKLLITAKRCFLRKENRHE